jgi:hypothetical protein
MAADLPNDLVPRGYSLATEAGGDVLSSTFGGRVSPIAPAEARAGDVLLVRSSTCRSHFLVLVEGGFIHADAGSRRVVERPGSVPWPIVAAWRVGEGG